MIRLISATLLLILLLYVGCSRSTQSNKNATAIANAAPAPEAKDEQGNSPLLQAVNKGDTNEVKRLVEGGADVNAASNSGVTPLMNAAGMGNKEAVELYRSLGFASRHRFDAMVLDTRYRAR